MVLHGRDHVDIKAGMACRCPTEFSFLFVNLKRIIMQKKQLLLIAALSIFMIIDSAFSKKHFPGSKTTAASTAHARYNYIWFTDPDFNDPTGSEGTIGQELERLRDDNPYNVFTATPSMGLHEYEWGYIPNEMPPIIYSDKP
jgi:hypothetical protein